MSKNQTYRISFLLILLLILTICSFVTIEEENFKKNKFISRDGYALQYQILLPKNYNANKTYPLVLFLHGAGERGDDNEKQLKHGVKLFASQESQIKFPCIVIAPQCPQDSYWASVEVIRDQTPYSLNFDYNKPSTAALNSAIELVQKMIVDKKATKSQIYITGLSMGGMGTFEAVYKHPKLFAAAIPVCGGGEEQKFSKKMAKVPFWVFHGESDSVVGVNHSREAVAKLKSLAGNVQYSEYPGVNHNSWDNAYAEPELLQWMFSKTK